jgi:hypothetical protein
LESYDKPFVYDSIVAAARRAQFPVIGHVPPDRNLEEVLGAFASIEHLTGYVESILGLSGRWTTDAMWIGLDHQSLIDTAVWMRPTFRADVPLRTIAAASRRAGVWNCPTLTVLEAFIHQLKMQPGKPAVLTTTQRLFEFALQITKALQDAGAGLLLSPEGHPFLIHRELQLLVQAGLTPYQALATGTRNVAMFLGTLDSTGTVAVGKRADLVLLEGNPLQNITSTVKPAGVMVAGRWLPRLEIEARLKTDAARWKEVLRGRDLEEARLEGR